MRRDHYKVLEVPRDASAEDIQHAYRALALRFHPDRNSSPEAAAKMAVINEAWETLGDARKRRDYDVQISKPAPNGDIVAAVLLAAREAILRGGWRVLEDGGRTLLLENARQKLRVALLDHVDNAALLRLARQYPELCVALAVQVEGPVQAGPSIVAIDLMRSERHGAPLPDGPCRSLLSTFL
jgi:curved DNA-binding protein CbpA